MENELVTNESFDENKYYKKISNLETEIDKLRHEAKDADLLETVTESGKWIFKKTELNPKKIEKLGEIARRQSELNYELMETQQAAMMLSLGSIEATKKVHENLTRLIKKHALDSSGKTSEIAERTSEQILRVAKFTKRYADMTEEIEAHTEEKLSDMQNRIETAMQKSFEAGNEKADRRFEELKSNSEEIINNRFEALQTGTDKKLNEQFLGLENSTNEKFDRRFEKLKSDTEKKLSDQFEKFQNDANKKQKSQFANLENNIDKRLVERPAIN